MSILETFLVEFTEMPPETFQAEHPPKFAEEIPDMKQYFLPTKRQVKLHVKIIIIIQAKIHPMFQSQLHLDNPFMHQVAFQHSYHQRFQHAIPII